MQTLPNFPKLALQSCSSISVSFLVAFGGLEKPLETVLVLASPSSFQSVPLLIFILFNRTFWFLLWQWIHNNVFKMNISLSSERSWLVKVWTSPFFYLYLLKSGAYIADCKPVFCLWYFLAVSTARLKTSAGPADLSTVQLKLLIRFNFLLSWSL